MTRKQMCGFAAIATALLTVAGAWNLVPAQQATPGAAPAAGNNRNFPGQLGQAPAGIPGGFPGGMGSRGTGGGMSSMGGGMGGWGMAMQGMGPAQEYDPEMAELAEAEATL